MFELGSHCGTLGFAFLWYCLQPIKQPRFTSRNLPTNVGYRLSTLCVIRMMHVAASNGANNQEQHCMSITCKTAGRHDFCSKRKGSRPKFRIVHGSLFLQELPSGFSHMLYPSCSTEGTLSVTSPLTHKTHEIQPWMMEVAIVA